ncbi:MAG TPA: ATP-binding cassette domain-containing protein [Candidatus Dormibacteraeota bacterium]|nr:ATP-binding cassette domain-containing protein [Candidatus Dormibacteraeota bacterium]
MSRLMRSAEWRFLGLLPKADRGLAVTWWGLILVRGALPAVFTLAIGALVGAVQSGHSLTGPLALAGIVFVALNALGPVHEAVAADLGARAGAWLDDRLIDACTRPPGLGHLEQRDLADELAASRNFDLGLASPPLQTSMPQIGNGFAEILSGLAQAAVLAGYRWWAALLVAGAWASTHVLLRESSLWKAWASESVTEEQRHVEYAYRLAVDAPAAKEIRLFGLADWAVDRFAARRRRMTEALFRERRLRMRPMRWSMAAIVLGNGLVFGSLARDALAGGLGLGSLVAFAQATIGTSALAFGEFDWWFRQSAQPIPKVLDLAERMEPAGSLAVGHRHAGGVPGQEVRLRDVRFAYASADTPVLDGFDLSIPAGASLAIVGPNGAGKTTLAKLICRLYDPQAGAILIDGVDLREFDLDSWRARIAAVFQDFVRYELPLRDNVAPADAPAPEALRALDLAGAAELADLATILSRAYEGGTELSSGQWQRVALARALCAVGLGAGVVLLDEPTAQLDVRAEAEIFDRILQAARGCTTILISHRFSTVRHADRICVLEHGRVIELGSHEELMALGGRYRTMFDLQAARF